MKATRLVCRLAIIAAGGLRCWYWRYELNPDGVSYLDIAAARALGGWDAVVNGYWSPFYPGLISLINGLPFASSTAVVNAHVASFLGLLVSLASFEYLLVVIGRVLDSTSPEGHGSERWYHYAFAYALFAWCALDLIDVIKVTPDQWVAAVVFAATALVIECGERLRPRHAWLLGLVLGVGYLTKAVLFVIGPIYLVALALGLHVRRGPLSLAVRATIAFLLTAAPYVTALSIAKDRPTFGDVGRLSYAWYVNGVTPFAHWRGGPEEAGVPAHPTRVVHNDPTIYEFGEPFRATYPPWYDASYWYEGIHIRLDPVRNASLLAEQVASMLEDTGTIWVAFFLLLATALGSLRRDTQLRSMCLILLPTAAAVLIYGMVRVETRYLGAFLVVPALLMGMLSRLVSGQNRRRLGSATLVLTAVVLAGPLLVETSRLLVAQPRTQSHIAAIAPLRDAGLSRDSRIAIIGDGVRAYWAQTAGLRIVAEIPSPAAVTFWRLDRAEQLNVFAIMRRAGAEYVVAEDPPTGSGASGWRVLEDLDLAVLALGEVRTSHR